MPRSQKVPLYHQPSQMVPTLCSKHAQGLLMVQAGAPQLDAYRLGEFCAPDAIRFYFSSFRPKAEVDCRIQFSYIVQPCSPTNVCAISSLNNSRRRLSKGQSRADEQRLGDGNAARRQDLNNPSPEPKCNK